MHDWSDDDDEYEALGLRVLLKAAISPESYAQATKEHCIALGVKESSRISKLGDKVWHQTFNDFKKAHGRAPTFLEHEAMLAQKQD